MKPLIIVESYTKTKTISKYLDNNYTVICSLGHFKDLSKNDLGIDTNTWKGTYTITNKKILDNLRQNAKNASKIFIASDPDMEGEAIAFHIKDSIKDLLKNKECYRIKFHEITKNAIIEAINNPHDINQDIVDAQESRRFLDRLVGYKLSPLLWNKYNNNSLSVGRVQSAALYMCIDALNKLNEYIPEPYWIVIGKSDIKLDFKLYNNNELVKIESKENAYKILDIIELKKYKAEFKESNSSESPSPPYTTTSLQQDAYNKLRFTSKKTMLLAQQLYENGLITYMRTDSTNISNQFKNIIIKYVNETYGESTSKFRTYKNKIANAQEAHEAIRITNINKFSTDLSDDHNKLYKLIWKRTIASQMINAEYINLDILINIIDNYKFIHKKSFLIKQGYLLVYDTQLDDINEFKNNLKTIKLKEIICDANINSPPSLYNEISLIKSLEKEGIGRPSTYTSIIDKLFNKHYVEKGLQPQKNISVQNIIKTSINISEQDTNINIGGKNKDYLVPSDLGIKIIEYLKIVVPFILDLKFTADMESTLDKICNKELTKIVVLDNFWNNHLKLIVENNQSLQSDNNNQSQKSRHSGIIQSKYGYCYYHAKDNKYTNIESYLKWKNISVDNLQERDIQFLKSLPKKLPDNTILHLGPYGLYIKDKNKNVKLDKSKWESYI
jgi:DNA topoisomerase-1